MCNLMYVHVDFSIPYVQLYMSWERVSLHLLLVIFKSETLGWAMTIAGALFIISGVLDVIKKNYSGGGISLAIGLAILILGWVAQVIVLLVLGILIAVKGIVALIDALKKKKIDVVEIVFTILTIVTGLMLAFGNGLDILLVIAGILLAVDGVVGLLAALKK